MTAPIFAGITLPPDFIFLCGIAVGGVCGVGGLDTTGCGIGRCTGGRGIGICGVGALDTTGAGIGVCRVGALDTTGAGICAFALYLIILAP